VWLFNVGRVIQNWRTALSLAWHEWFSCKKKNERFTAASLRCCQNLKNENFTSSFGRLGQKVSPKNRAPRAARLFTLIQPIKSLICDVVVAISYSLISETKQRAKYTHARTRIIFDAPFELRVLRVSRARVFSPSVSCWKYRPLAVQNKTSTSRWLAYYQNFQFRSLFALASFLHDPNSSSLLKHHGKCASLGFGTLIRTTRT